VDTRYNGRADGHAPGEPAGVTTGVGCRTGGFSRGWSRRVCGGWRLPCLPRAPCQNGGFYDPDNRDSVDSFGASAVGRRPSGTGATVMSIATLYGLCAAALVGLGLFGLIVHPQPLRKILAFNLIGGGVFLLFGAVAHRGAAAGLGGDPVPQALVI